MSDQASKQPATPEELFASIAECPQQILLKKLLDLPPAQSGEVLEWFMERFDWLAKPYWILPIKSTCCSIGISRNTT